jgi:putative transposase
MSDRAKPGVARSSQPRAGGQIPFGDTAKHDLSNRNAVAAARGMATPDHSLGLAPEMTAHKNRFMPQSLSAVYIHLVFSTKERRPFLRDKPTREELHAYLGGISKQLECAPIRVGGIEDHIHLLARLGRTITQADWVKELKRVSNLWLKQRGNDYADFEWQTGYADFSVSQSNLEQVKRYIEEQEEHHRKIGFQDELRTLLRKHEIQWDERYIWD